jgi:hypothetical protein
MVVECYILGCWIPYQTNLVGNNLVDWGDDNTRIVCEIFANEVIKGNRSSTHFHKTSTTM